MKKLLCLIIVSMMIGGCNTPQKSNGFATALEGYSWHISDQASVDLIVALDKVWGKDYDAMRTFFVDTTSFAFATGEQYNTVDGFIGHVKKQMENSTGWTMDYAFAVDLSPGEGGDLVNAAFTVEAPESDPEKSKEIIYEWYYVKNGKIHNWTQSKQIVLK